MPFAKHLFSRTLLAALLAAGLARPGTAWAQDVRDLLHSSPKLLRAFRPVVGRPGESTVRVRCEGKDVALGTVVAADGWVITKASVLNGKALVCRFKGGSELPARLVGVQVPYDLALLKVEGKGLAPVEWRDSKDAAVGKWVASVGPGEDPVAVGVVSVATRAYKQGDQPPKTLNTKAGYLGVGLAEAEGGAKITAVMPGTPAAKVGLKTNDLVTHIAGKKILDAESMINAVGRHKPGAEIEIRFKRGKEVMSVTAKLAKRPPFLNGNPQELMGSALSNRRGGFPTILQHDTVLRPGDCGGPLVDLDGKAVGINIARAGRTETYAVPSEDVRRLLPELMSGRLAPGKEAPAEKQPPPAKKK
jgi:serine protease Do